MTVKEIEKYIEFRIESAKKNKDFIKDRGRDIKDLAFEVYRTIAEHFDNVIPSSINDAFARKVPGFKKYLEKKAKEQEDIVEKLERTKRQTQMNAKLLEDQINKLRNSGISVVDYHSMSKEKKEEKRANVENLLNLLVNESSKEKPEELNKSLIFLYESLAFDYRGEKRIYKEYHELFINKYPPFKEYLRKYNQEDRIRKLEKELAAIKKENEEATRKLEVEERKIIKVYDDTPRGEAKSTQNADTSRREEPSQIRNVDPCGMVYRRC